MSSLECANIACEHIAVGDTVKEACAKAGISTVTFFKQLSLPGNAALVNNYAQARNTRADTRFEKLDDLTQELREGKIDPQQARVLLDALKWQVAKEAPKKYGDSLDLNVKNSTNRVILPDAE